MDYLVLIEKANDGSYSAYIPDLPGCVACGDTREEAQQLIQEAIAHHIESMRAHNQPIPPASTTATVVHAA